MVFEKSAFKVGVLRKNNPRISRVWGDPASVHRSLKPRNVRLKREWHEQIALKQYGNMPESLGKPHQSKDMLFLNRNSTQENFPTPKKKSFFFRSKKISKKICKFFRKKNFPIEIQKINYRKILNEKNFKHNGGIFFKI